MVRLSEIIAIINIARVSVCADMQLGLPLQQDGKRILWGKRATTRTCSWQLSALKDPAADNGGADDAELFDDVGVVECGGSRRACPAITGTDHKETMVVHAGCGARMEAMIRSSFWSRMARDVAKLRRTKRS